jgi:predicted Zn finger-like uncharacterized protein
MMLTRCPACQTVFRLRPEQLYARQGRVRCGSCHQPFDALQHRVDDWRAADGEAGGREAAPGRNDHSVPAAVVSARHEPDRQPAPDAVPAPDAGPAASSAEVEADSARLDAIYGRPRAAVGPLQHTLAGLGAGLLAGVLAVQAVYLFRIDIAREMPRLRPALEAACAAFACEVPLPREAAAISIESSDLQAEPGRHGQYVLHASLRNRAGYPLAWPHLELTLTDAADRPVARRAMPPQEWVPAGQRDGGFAGHSGLAVRLPFETRELAPTGYRLYVFYP